MIRSALAVLAGIVVLTGTSFASRSALVANVPERAAQPRGDQSHLPATLFQLAYTLLYIAAGGYATASLVRRLQLRHAVIMGMTELALTAWAMFAFRHGRLSPCSPFIERPHCGTGS
jgi:hypothetical protein